MADTTDNWMQTFTGEIFVPSKPLASSINIIDIAQGLSQTCRWAGQSHYFFSVAEHSWHTSHLVPPEHALAALMHDATEAYICDVPRPVKNLLGEVYKDLEQKVWEAIVEAYPQLPAVLPDEVKEADNAMLMCEAQRLLGPAPQPWGEGIVPAERDLGYWSPLVARQHFLDRFYELINR